MSLRIAQLLQGVLRLTFSVTDAHKQIITVAVRDIQPEKRLTVMLFRHLQLLHGMIMLHLQSFYAHQHVMSVLV
jgi:hypothetical protein